MESLVKRTESDAKARFRGNSLSDINTSYKHLYTDPNLRIRMVLQFIIVEGGLICDRLLLVSFSITFLLPQALAVKFVMRTTCSAPFNHFFKSALGKFAPLQRLAARFQTSCCPLITASTVRLVI